MRPPSTSTVAPPATNRSPSKQAPARTPYTGLAYSRAPRHDKQPPRTPPAGRRGGPPAFANVTAPLHTGLLADADASGYEPGSKPTTKPATTTLRATTGPAVNYVRRTSVSAVLIGDELAITLTTSTARSARAYPAPL